MKKILIFLSLIAVACVSVPQKLNPTVYYKHDICFEYETGQLTEQKIKSFFKRFKKGKYRKTQQVREKATFCGVGVLPNLDEYSIKVTSHGDLNLFALSTCHEENTTENPDKGIFKKKGQIRIKYVPTIEKGLACPLYVSAFDRRQRHAWGVIAFEHPRYQLPAKVSCNGMIENYDGVSICQSRNKLIQRITFTEPVKLIRPVKGAADRQEECPVLGADGQKEYTFKLPNRECIYGFIGKESKKIHQMYTIGYEEIIVRE